MLRTVDARLYDQHVCVSRARRILLKRVCEQVEIAEAISVDFNRQLARRIKLKSERIARMLEVNAVR
ncbi:hypothetical protein D3C78_1703070 [compost metagenome]